MRVSTAQITEFIADDLQNAMVSNRKIAEQYRARGVRHCRSGRIDSRCSLREARGVAVHAYKPDGLGGLIALCADGLVRQFVM